MACHSLNRPRSKPHLIVQQRQVQLAQLLQRVGQVGVRLAVGGGRHKGARWERKSAAVTADPIQLYSCAQLPLTLKSQSQQLPHLCQTGLLHDGHVIVLDAFLRRGTSQCTGRKAWSDAISPAHWLPRAALAELSITAR